MNGPSSIKSTSDRVARNFQFLAPLADCLGAPVQKQFAIRSSIRQLNVRGTPSAIFRAVVAIDIDAIKRMLVRWSKAHIVQEIHKRFAPTITDLDTATTVSLVSCGVVIFASRTHVTPSDVFASLRKTVGQIHVADVFYPNAAARSGFTVSEVACSGECRTSTFAFTQPSEPVTFRRQITGWLHYEQFTETLTKKQKSTSSHMGDFTLLGAN